MQPGLGLSLANKNELAQNVRRFLLSIKGTISTERLTNIIARLEITDNVGLRQNNDFMLLIIFNRAFIFVSPSVDIASLLSILFTKNIHTQKNVLFC